MQDIRGECLKGIDIRVFSVCTEDTLFLFISTFLWEEKANGKFKGFVLLYGKTDTIIKVLSL